MEWRKYAGNRWKGGIVEMKEDPSNLLLQHLEGETLST